MYTKHFTTLEEVRKLKAEPTPIVIKRFQRGIENGNEVMAVAAMEELLHRGEADIIVSTIITAIEKKQIIIGSPMAKAISCSLMSERNNTYPAVKLSS